jgi:hypothetical protein
MTGRTPLSGGFKQSVSSTINAARSKILPSQVRRMGDAPLNFPSRFCVLFTHSGQSEGWAVN